MLGVNLKSQLISLFLPSVHGGGAERAMLVFAHELIKKNFRVDLVLAKLEGALSDGIPAGVRIVDLGSSRMLAAIPRLIRYFKSSDPLAIFSTITHANIAAAWAARYARVSAPLIIRQSNAPLSETQDSFGRMLASHFIPCSYGLADGIIAVSEGVREQLMCISPAFERKTHVLPTPVLTEEIRTLADQPVDHPWCKDPSIPLVVSAGRLKPHKGMLDLIRAFRHVRNVRRSRLIILGEGPDRARLESEIAKLRLGDDVILPGFSSNPFPYMKIASVFVLASHYEGLPNVLIQALGFGTPVVATDCESGPAEILQNGRWGKLVPLGAIEQLAEAIEQSLGFPRQIEAQQSAWDRFGAERAAQAYLAVAGLTTSATSACP